MGQVDEAASILHDYIRDNLQNEALQNDIVLAILLYGQLPVHPDESLFRLNSPSGRIEAKLTAGRVLSMDFDRNNSLLSALLGKENVDIVKAILATHYSQPAQASDSLPGYLARLCNMEKYYYSQPSALSSNILLASVVSGKILPLQATLALLRNIHDYSELGPVMTYAVFAGYQRNLGDSLIKAIRGYSSHIDNYNNWSVATHYLQSCAYLDQAICLPAFLSFYNCKAICRRRHRTQLFADKTPD